MVEKFGQRIVTAIVDVRDYDHMKAVLDDGVEQLGRLDIVVANAGIGTSGIKLHKMDEDLWQETIDINLTGVFKTVKAAVPHMLANGGSIIMTSSVGGGIKPYPNVGNYVGGQARRRRPDAIVRRRARQPLNPRQLDPPDPRQHAAV